MPGTFCTLGSPPSGIDASAHTVDASWDPSEIFAHALDWLNCGVMIVDKEMRPLFANHAAAQLIESGRLLLTRKSTLYRADPIEDLRRAVASLEFESDAATCRIGEPPLICSVVSLAGHGGSRSAHAILFVADPKQTQTIQIADVVALGLSRAEGAVAVEFANGHSLKACASRLAISFTTAKSHLHRIFRKTGACRQAELMRLILTARPPFKVTDKN